MSLLFGELLMRLQTPQRERFVQASQFDVHYTGGEANAGVLLSALGARCRIVSAVPDTTGSMPPPAAGIRAG
jgi:2-dehydro-3-deoxygluconokinase